MTFMERRGFEIRVAGLLALVACAAVNLWLFRIGTLPGLIGLNLTKHVAIAVICRDAGVNRRRTGDDPSPPPIDGPAFDALPRSNS